MEDSFKEAQLSASTQRERLASENEAQSARLVELKAEYKADKAAWKLTEETSSTNTKSLLDANNKLSAELKSANEKLNELTEAVCQLSLSHSLSLSLSLLTLIISHVM